VGQRSLEIWLVSQSYLPYYGGITEHVWHVAQRLAVRGHRVSILTGRPLANGHPARDADPPGVVVHRLGRTLRVPSNGARACVTFGWGWRERLAAMRLAPPDIVHIHSPLEPWLPLWALRALPGVKVGTFHTGGSQDHWGYRHFASRLAGPLGELHARIAVSREAARYVSAHFPGEYRIVPNGVDTARFCPRADLPSAAPAPALRLLFVGRCDPRKGLATLLDALALAGHSAGGGAGRPRLHLRVVGDGPERHRLARRARAHGLPVEFVGGIPRADLPGQYREADLFVAPSIDGESFGVSLLEALATGLPVIASRIPGYAETLRDSGAALLVEPGSARALGGALIALAGDSVRRARMGECGREFARRFDWDRLAGEIEGLYRGLLGEPPVTPRARVARLSAAGSGARS
jgi:phosphatidylinositol alpha-mannosyltransferase